MSASLAAFAADIANGRIRVVDLTQTLEPDFPTIVLPPEFGQAAPFRIEEISRYDARGPAWYWNNISFGEHTGTHFDAPAHWVTGRDAPNGTVDSIDPQRFFAPACVIDCSRACAGDPDYLLEPADIAAFCREIIGIETKVRHLSGIGTWNLNTSSFAGEASCTTEWGTERRHAGLLIDDALNASIPTRNSASRPRHSAHPARCVCRSGVSIPINTSFNASSVKCAARSGVISWLPACRERQSVPGANASSLSPQAYPTLHLYQ